MRLARLVALAICAAGMLAFPAVAAAGHENDPRTDNLRPRGHIFEPAVLGGFGGANSDIHTDEAFWGKLAIQGNWDGFNIRDISSPNRPRQVSRTFCDGNQGDVIVYRDIVVRSWNTPAGSPGPFGAGLTCDGQAVAPGFEGLHVFDISNLANPVLVAQVPLACGSHTATAVPDRRNDRLLVYSSSAQHSPTNPNPPATCDWFDIVEVPLDDPGSARFLRAEPSMHSCHDIGVILGNVLRAGCAGGDGFRMFSLGGPSGGSLEDPQLMHHVVVPTVTVGHSASFTWDGRVTIFGHEPGGGVAAECEATDDPFKKSFFFYDTETGAFLGMWTLPRPQGPTENCSLHNYNMVPLRDGRDLLVSGNYQAGTWVVDLTDPANARTVAWSDPPPKPVPPGTPFCCDVTGAWSTYWYDGFIYETNIGEGLNIFKLKGRETRTAIKLRHLNPQTQEFALDGRRGGDDDDDDDDRRGGGGDDDDDDDRGGDDDD
jgi:LVIVD repeat